MFRYNTDANVVNDLKNDSSYEFIGEIILKINVVYKAEKIKVKVYVNQHESVSHIQIRHAYDFSLCFLHELLMSFLNVVYRSKLSNWPLRKIVTLYILRPYIWRPGFMHVLVY
jgi:hypothetical protein